MATIRALLFSILGEGSLLTLFIVSQLLDYFSLFSIKDICIMQINGYNVLLGTILFLFILWINMLLDGFKLPFDYTECESELVAGLVTEFSGAFFVIYSVMEISHLLLTTLLLSILVFGGTLITLKSITILIFCFFLPRVIGIRLKITTAQTFISLYLNFTSFFLISWLGLSKFLCCIL